MKQELSHFKDAYVNSEVLSLQNSSSGSPTNSPPLAELSKHKSLNIPIINVKTEHADTLLSKSTDIKRQLSHSFQGITHPGGIQKPQLRKNSLARIKSNDSVGDDEDGEGNERKRRDNINDKIQELLTLIPAEFFQPGKDLKDNKNGEDGEPIIKNSGTKDGKPNKGQILTSSVEYIQYLQDIIDKNNREEIELILKLQSLNSQISNQISPTSAEIALGEIGVGTESEEYFKNVLINASKSGRRGSCN